MAEVVPVVRMTDNGDGSADFTITFADDDHKFSAVSEDGIAIVTYEETLSWRGQIRVSEPDETVYKVCRVSHEHPDVLREAMPQYMDHSEPENMVGNLLSDVPVHPGAADFLEEMGVWDDSMERA
jgi:TRAP-type uncharacterized transport system substrate-binding protein